MGEDGLLITQVWKKAELKNVRPLNILGEAIVLTGDKDACTLCDYGTSDLIYKEC